MMTGELKTKHEREKVEYEAPEVILDRITSLEEEIVAALNDFRKMI